MPFVNGLLLPETVNKIPHDRGMVAPSLGWFLNLTVPPEEAVPAPGGIPAGEADGFSPGTANHQSKTGSLVGDLVKGPCDGIESLEGEAHGKRMRDEL
jgi:hypothetical protein